MSKAASTRNVLGEIGGHLRELVGVREEGVATGNAQPRLSPVASPRDVGRRPNRKFGRVAVDRVVPDPEQPRTEFDPDELERLSESLKDRGQLAPVRVRWSEPAGAWMLISGERRWRATRAAGLPEIDCYFHDDGLSRTEILEEQLVENMLRSDLKPVEEARSFEELMTANGWGTRELARRLRVNPSRVSRALALLKLPEDLRRRVEAGELSARAGYELSKLDGEEAQRSAANADGGTVTHEQAAEAVRRQSGPAKPRGTRRRSQTGDGWRVTVSRGRTGTLSEVAEALRRALGEVELRLDSGVGD